MNRMNHSDTLNSRSCSIRTKRMGLKCCAERKELIKRQIGLLIKKELKCFKAHKKIEKEMQKQNKDIIMMEVPSALERVKEFRIKEKENNVRKLEKYFDEVGKSDVRVSQRLEDKKLLNEEKNACKLDKMLKAKNKFTNLQLQNLDKVEVLKQQLSKHSPRYSNSYSRYSRKSEGQNTDNRISFTVNLINEKQDKFLNSYLSKIKEHEERCIQKQISIQEKKKLKNQPKCLIQKRSQYDEQFKSKWEVRLFKKFEKFQKHRNAVLDEKENNLYNRQLEKNQAMEKIWEKKIHNEEVYAHKRIEMVQKKLQKIKHLENNKKKKEVKIKQFSEQNNENDYQKEMHSDKMREIYNVLLKLKGLDSTHKLNPSEVKILEDNLKYQQEDVTELLEFIKMSKDKFFEKKQKEEQEKIKKKSKKNGRMI